MTPTPKVTFSDLVVSDSSPSTSSSDDAVKDVESLLEPKLLAILGDRPKIADFAKTLLSHEMAHEASSVIRDAHYVQLDANQLLTTIRRVLSVINSLKIENPEVWARKHPQREDQTGMARIDEITSRRVLYIAHSHVTKSGKKHTTSFGRLFLTQIWPDVVAAVNSSVAAASATNPDDPLTYVMSLIERSLPDENSLLWAKDLRAVLYLRNEERKRVAAERIQREFAESVSSAFAAQQQEGDEEDDE